ETVLEVGGIQHLRRPAAVPDIQQQCARSVRNINGAFSGQPKSHVILRQHDRANTCPLIRFVLPDPQQLCQGEVWKGWIAGEFDKSAGSNFLCELPALAIGADVTPD